MGRKSWQQPKQPSAAAIGSTIASLTTAGCQPRM